MSLSDLVLTRFLRQKLKDRPLTDIEVRVSGGDIFVVGELVGEHNAPFLIRFRIEPAGGFERQTLLFSAYSAQVYAPHRVNAPVIAGWILDVFEPYGPAPRRYVGFSQLPQRHYGVGLFRTRVENSELSKGECHACIG